MANAAIKWNVKVKQSSGGSICGRARNSSAACITQSGITSISVKYRTLGKTGDTTTTSLTVASVVFDTLQTDAYWNKIDGVAVDTIGYNFRWNFGAAVFTEPVQYVVVVTFTPASGAVWWDEVLVDLLPLLA